MRWSDLTVSVAHVRVYATKIDRWIDGVAEVGLLADLLGLVDTEIDASTFGVNYFFAKIRPFLYTIAATSRYRLDRENRQIYCPDKMKLYQNLLLFSPRFNFLILHIRRAIASWDFSTPGFFPANGAPRLMASSIFKACFVIDLAAHNAANENAC